MRRMLGLLAAPLLFWGTTFLPVSPARAASFSPDQRAEIVQIVRDALKSDPTILREAIDALQADDSRADAAATDGTIKALGPDLGHNPADPSEGNPKGDVTVVEFFDPRCPYCRKMIPEVADLLSHDPNLRVVYKDIPILGPASLLASKALLAAQIQGGYLKMRQAVMTGPAEISRDSLHAAATHAGLDWSRIERDMDAPAVQARLRNNLEMAHKLNIQGTPAYVIGAEIYSGAIPEQEMTRAIAAARKGG